MKRMSLTVGLASAIRADVVMLLEQPVDDSDDHRCEQREPDGGFGIEDPDEHAGEMLMSMTT